MRQSNKIVDQIEINLDIKHVNVVIGRPISLFTSDLIKKCLYV